MFGVSYLYFVSFQVTVKTDDMDLAGDIIQALASFLGIEVDILPNNKLHLMLSSFCSGFVFVFNVDLFQYEPSVFPLRLLSPV